MKNGGLKLNVTAGFVALLLLGGCTISTPSQVAVDRITVSEKYESIALDQTDLKPDVIANIVDEYNRNSTGEMNVYVAYAKYAPDGAVHAAHIASNLRESFTAKGVSDLNVTTVESHDETAADTVVVSYKKFEANEPENCGRLTGTFGAGDIDDVSNYQLGCEHMRYTSRMISDPTDLLGKSGTRDADARRAGNIVERYRSGEEFEALETSSASEIGN